MARRRRRQQSDSPDIERVLFTPPVRTLTAQPLLRGLPTWSPMTDIEDRRLYHPLEYFRPARTWAGSDAPAVVPKPAPRNKPRAFLAHGLKFPEPAAAGVLVCVRRKQRKEVLHALKKTGRGRGGGRKRRNWWSSISC